MISTIASVILIATIAFAGAVKPVAVRQLSFEKSRSLRALSCDGTVKTLNFDDFNKGDVIDASSSFVDGVIVKARRAGDGEAYDDGMIFDATDVSGDDYDLGNFHFLNKMLIISADNDGSDPDDAGVGGEVLIEFPYAIQMHLMRFVDFDTRGSDVLLFDENGDLIKGFKMPTTLDGGQKTVEMSQGGVWSLKVRLVGSGGLDDISFSRDC